MDCRFFITSVIRDLYSVTWSVKYLLAFGNLFLMLCRQLFSLKNNVLLSLLLHLQRKKTAKV